MNLNLQHHIEHELILEKACLQTIKIDFFQVIRFFIVGFAKRASFEIGHLVSVIFMSFADFFEAQF